MAAGAGLMTCKREGADGKSAPFLYMYVIASERSERGNLNLRTRLSSYWEIATPPVAARTRACAHTIRAG
jgi:hypothetical protein